MAFSGFSKRGGRFSVILWAVTAAATVVALAATPAEAARKKNRGGGYSPPYAAMVVDAKTGRTLHAVNENALRHPASITKVMTLYMLFEQMERGRFEMDSPLRVSAYAASRPPSKIGVRAGGTIDVEDAIKALITKSANDVAVVVAENLAGDEDSFAEQMTRRARSLGMSRTVFKNASGLPDAQQVTTARDLTILARAVQERFPRYFSLFQTRHFDYAGRSYRNHNKLLGRVEGVDGIKTGYTRMSGFNLMTSAKSDGRHIVSIVLGGRSGRGRDTIMAGLVTAHLPRASAGPRSTLVAQLPAENREDQASAAEPKAEPRVEPRLRVAEQPRPQPQRSASETPATPTATVATARPAARSIDLAAARPVVASAAVFAAPTPTSTSAQAMRWASGAPAAGGREIRPAQQTASLARPAEARPADIRPVEARAAVQVIPVAVAANSAVRPPAAVPSASQVTAQRPAPSAPAPAVARAEASRTEPSRTEAIRPPANVQFTSSIAKAPATQAEKAPEAAASGWMIQLGATDDEGKAKTILSNARSKSRAVAEAKGFTQTVERGGSTLFRARFAGFDDQSEANNACRDLKRSGFSCFATRT